MSSYLTTASALSTYQTISNMSNYIDLTSTQTLSGLKLFSTVPRIGLDCLRVFQSGTNNIGYGNSSMYNFLNGNNNVCYGNSSLYAAINSSGNTSIGSGSLLSYSGTSNNIGFNSALGYQSAASNNCTFLGANSSVSSTTTAYTQSTAVGANSVIDSSFQIKMGSSSETVDFPSSANFRNTVNNYNNTIYFYNSAYSSTFVNYKKMNFDSTGSLSIYNQSGVGVFLAPNNTSWSDYRIKKNITYLSNNESDNILKLKPCTYNYVSDDEKRIGFIAQDLEEVYPNLIENGSYSDELQDNIKAINT